MLLSKPGSGSVMNQARHDWDAHTSVQFEITRRINQSFLNITCPMHRKNTTTLKASKIVKNVCLSFRFTRNFYPIYPAALPRCTYQNCFSLHAAFDRHIQSKDEYQIRESRSQVNEQDMKRSWLFYHSRDESERVLSAIEYKKQIEPFHIHPLMYWRSVSLVTVFIK